MRLLLKNLGRGMPESVVREGLELLDICFQGVTQLRSGRRDHDPTKDCPPAPISFSQWREAGGCGLRVSGDSYVAAKDPLQCKLCQPLRHPQRNYGNTPRCVACGGSQSSGGALPRRDNHSDVAAGKQHGQLPALY